MKAAFIIFSLFITLGVHAQNDFLFTNSVFNSSFDNDKMDVNALYVHINDNAEKIRLAGVSSIDVGNFHWEYNKNGLLVNASETDNISNWVATAFYSYDGNRISSQHTLITSQEDDESDTIMSCYEFSYNEKGLFDTIKYRLEEDYFFFPFGDMVVSGNFNLIFSYDEFGNITKREIILEPNDSVYVLDNDIRINPVVKSSEATNFVDSSLHISWKNTDLLVDIVPYSYMKMLISNQNEQPDLMIEQGRDIYNCIYQNSSILTVIEKYSKSIYSGSLYEKDIWRCRYNSFCLPDTVFMKHDTIKYFYTYFPEIQNVILEECESQYKNTDYIVNLQKAELKTVYKDRTTLIKGVDEIIIPLIIDNKDSFFFHDDYLMLAVHNGNRFFYNKDTLVLYQQQGKKIPEKEKIIALSNELLVKAFADGQKVNPAFGVHLYWTGIEPQTVDFTSSWKSLLFPFDKLDNLKYIECSDSDFVVCGYSFVSKCLSGDLIDINVESNIITNNILRIMKNAPADRVWFENITVRQISTGKKFPMSSVAMRFY